MANRNRNAYDVDRLSPPASDRSSEPREFILNKPISDDVIRSLSNNYENKRARQVSEWQRVQAANVRRVI